MNWTDLHSVNPYKDFPLHDWKQDLTGWMSDEALFGELIAEVKPRLVVEVGSWKGLSAIHMAKLVTPDCRIVCVDTFLGALEFWTRRDDPERFGSLLLKNGYPQVYYQFLANVIYAGMQETIIPFPQTSLIAARWFAQAGFKSDLVYLDGSHDGHDVMWDIIEWWPTVRPGGIMFGDDLQTFQSVRDAFDGVKLSMQSRERANKSAYGIEKKECEFETRGNKWVMRKPV